MDNKFKLKYFKYKNKYLKYKNQIGGNDNIIGINYEAGKIITHILQFEKCIAYANIQIAMDAPYEGREAPESVRVKARAETQFPCYNEKYLVLQLEKIFNFIKNNFSDKKIVVQIARGRAAKPMFDEVLEPIMKNVGMTNIDFVNGYRSTDYFTPTFEEEFIFVNVGMYAVLRGVERVQVAEICNPDKTIIITSYEDNLLKTDYKITNFDDGKNILNSLPFFQKITLAGIADDMKFVTKEVYKVESICDLIDNLDKI